MSEVVDQLEAIRKEFHFKVLTHFLSQVPQTGNLCEPLAEFGLVLNPKRSNEIFPISLRSLRSRTAAGLKSQYL